MAYPASSKVKSNVPTVHLLDDGSVVLNVRFDGFTANEPVEISGYVTQDSGAYSAFYCETKVPGDYDQTQEADASQNQEADASETQVTASVPVTIKGIAHLQQTKGLVVVAKVAKVWPTVLTPGSANPTNADQTNVEATIRREIGERTVLRTWTAKDPPEGVNW
jgi:hypothetical protein